MESRVNYTIVGVFVVVLGALLIIFFLWLANLSHSKSYNTYLVYVKEDVTGLAIDTPVRFNGVPVGSVKKIELDPNNSQLVRLTLAIEEGTPITTTTVASLQFQGITGVLYIGLQATTINAPFLKAVSGEEYPVIPYKPSFIIQMSEVLPQLARSVASIGDRVTKLLSDENQQSIQDSLKSIATFTGMLAKNSDRMNQTITALQATFANTAAATKDLPDILRQLKITLASAAKSAVQIDLAARKVEVTMSSGNLAIKNFSSQLLPSAQQLINQLNQVTSNLKQTTDQLKQNPSILLRGSQRPSPGPGE